ncbi:type II toxin-antitoxin system RelE/ParE family toxin [Asticcacaulis excentricus]|uniref:Plasmid stabilization system n=1 Tax=Asticcacaulis excentricus (strain ATCC 15261 / DSM 4724 / KCTC 12464 / NCIMB 9791 / VKM B-1370 / CB 48) TaxID=573065 RepID=E8RRW0_ASTEC|nr:type II toxin-antitoxin system RelE/ParE family toxin [Asticcacaulis excentricus]ADU13485.1 plasmid stabilization system [Asticcacaulis excentricus CB 48]
MPYVLTRYAESAFRQIGSDTQILWGREQAAKYLNRLRSGFEQLAQRPDRGRPIEVPQSTLQFLMFRVEQHYIVYAKLDQHRVAIAAVLHQRMDVPKRVAEIPRKSIDEINRLMGRKTS